MLPGGLPDAAPGSPIPPGAAGEGGERPRPSMGYSIVLEPSCGETALLAESSKRRLDVRDGGHRVGACSRPIPTKCLAINMAVAS